MSDNQDEESKIIERRSRSRDRNEDIDDDRDDRRNIAREERNDAQQQQSSSGNADGVTNLYVRNLSLETSEDALRAAFTVYGEVTNASIVREPVTLASRGFGFVAFRHLEHAEAALDAMINGGAQVDGCTIKIEKARRSAGYDKTPGRYLGPPGMSMKHGTQPPTGRDDYRFSARGGPPRRGDSRDRDRDYRGGGGGGFIPPHNPVSRYPPRDARYDYRFAPAPMRGDPYEYRDDPRGYDSRSGDPRGGVYPQQAYRGGGVPPMMAGAPGGHYRDDPRDNYPPRGGYSGNGGSGYRGVPPMAAGGVGGGGFRDERMYDRDYIRPLPHVGAGGHPGDHPPYIAPTYDHPRGGERGGAGAGGYGSRDRVERERDRDYPSRSVPSAAHAIPYDRHAIDNNARSTDRPPHRGGGEKY